MRKPFSIVLAILVLTGALPLLAACHTTAGAGEDICRRACGDARRRQAHAVAIPPRSGREGVNVLATFLRASCGEFTTPVRI